MESALRPREIQARVRAGESLEEVAEVAGVPIERIAPFAGPVLAERAYIAGLAQEAHVRRQGEATSTRTLIDAVTEQLSARGIERGDVIWDSWKLDGRRWHIQADYRAGSTEHHATFAFDLDGRFSVATNKDARWLIADDMSARSRPGEKPRGDDPDSEPTLDLDDELALVRAVNVERDPYDDPSETGDAYTPGDLAEVDGVYDIVPPKTDMDVLYDMLATFNEDSVQIYRGLTQPVVVDDDVADADHTEATEPDAAPGTEPDAAELPRTPEADAEPSRAEPSVEVETGATPAEDSPRAEAGATGAPVAQEAGDVVLASGESPVADAPPDEPAPARRRRRPRPVPAEPEQPTLDDTTSAARPQPKTSARRSRRRASVPSWDEIMFGSPTQPDDQR
ncbi:septation protein SepH [Propionicicella superfundia]|uniref:septation protein SepH n=1 Tax=Propionicicella superfundia TaxID=348582 RepID=UPI0004230602|nr:septation protein SepH [Propionicicella superfundia]